LKRSKQGKMGLKVASSAEERPLPMLGLVGIASVVVGTLSSLSGKKVESLAAEYVRKGMSLRKYIFDAYHVRRNWFCNCFTLPSKPSGYGYCP